MCSLYCRVGFLSRAPSLCFNWRRNCVALIFDILRVDTHCGSNTKRGHIFFAALLAPLAVFWNGRLLARMDGFQELDRPTLLVALTNRIDLLDSALLRPGRFEVQVCTVLCLLYVRVCGRLPNDECVVTSGTAIKIDTMYIEARGDFRRGRWSSLLG